MRKWLAYRRLLMHDASHPRLNVSVAIEVINRIVEWHRDQRFVEVNQLVLS